MCVSRVTCMVSLAGRDETEVQYDVGFRDDGRIVALNIRGFFLVGAELDLGDNDPAVLSSGIDQAGPCCAQPLTRPLCLGIRAQALRWLQSGRPPAVLARPLCPGVRGCR